MTTFTQSSALAVCVHVGLDTTQANMIVSSWDTPWPPTKSNLSANTPQTVGYIFNFIVSTSNSNNLKRKLTKRLVEPLTGRLDYADQLLSRVNTETKARNYAWRQSIEKGIKLCRENGHEGDAQTLEDIINFIEQD